MMNSKLPLHEDYVLYPESPLRERTKLAHGWIPDGCQRLLDGGCAFGYATCHFQDKAREVYGVDPNEDFIGIAKKRHPGIHFFQAGLERVPFEPEFFDVVVLNDVLEHVADEQMALNEMCRVLRPGGSFIITTPHPGLFTFMDPDNLVYHLRTKLPGVYRWLFRIKYGRYPEKVKPGYAELHRHYSLKDFGRLLDRSDFKGRHDIDRVFRGGLLVGVLGAAVYEVLSLTVGLRWARRLIKPMHWLADRDYFVPYGILSYNIAIRIRKQPGDHTK